MSLNFKCRSMSESGLLILPWFLPSHVPEENLWEDKVSKVYAGQMPFLSLSVSSLKAAYDTWSDNCTSPLRVQIFQRIPANSLQSRRTIPDLVKLWIVSFYVTEYMLIFRPHCKHSIRCSIVLQMSVYLSCVSVCWWALQNQMNWSMWFGMRTRVGPNHDFAHIPHIGVTLGALWPVEKNGKA